MQAVDLDRGTGRERLHGGDRHVLTVRPVRRSPLSRSSRPGPRRRGRPRLKSPPGGAPRSPDPASGGIGPLARCAARERDLASHGLDGTHVLPPPRLPAGARRGVMAILRRRPSTCLERALVLQRWDAAHGAASDVVIGVPRPRRRLRRPRLARERCPTGRPPPTTRSTASRPRTADARAHHARDQLRPRAAAAAAAALPETAATPRAAFEAAILPGLRRSPCLVSFSGGRDSSAVLATATAVARREGLPLPVPITHRFPSATGRRRPSGRSR